MGCSWLDLQSIDELAACSRKSKKVTFKLCFEVVNKVDQYDPGDVVDHEDDLAIPTPMPAPRRKSKTPVPISTPRAKSKQQATSPIEKTLSKRTPIIKKEVIRAGSKDIEPPSFVNTPFNPFDLPDIVDLTSSRESSAVPLSPFFYRLDEPSSPDPPPLPVLASIEEE
ncbi:hypothetical protein KCU78_g6200, partial [Aureobasidium melanogenum]